ncbi:MAG: DCC1-like thiol-disulfide oxidoreductase family protein [Planctomycetota bacterium]
MGGDASRPPIVFFDGVCSLCNHFVRLLVRLDRRRLLHFAPLQGETAHAMLPELARDPAQWSVVYVDGSGRYERSDAVLRIFARVGGWLRPLSWLRIVPRPLRDWAYGFVAQRRYRWFGRSDACPLPTAEQRRQMLP